MYQIRLTGNLLEQIRESGRQVRVAAADALNHTAANVRAALYEEMAYQFDRPTPYTLNSLYLQAATPDNLTAEVRPKTDFATSSGGAPADKYLAPEIFGGERGMKRLERRLQFYGAMRAGQYAVPGRGAQLDQYGNLSRGQVTQILTQLGLLLDVTSNSLSAKSRKRLGKKGLLVRGGEITGQRGGQYFVARSKKTGLPLGIYKIAGPGRVEPVIVFVNKPNYRRRLDWFGLAEKTVAERLDGNFETAMARALERVSK